MRSGATGGRKKARSWQVVSLDPGEGRLTKAIGIPAARRAALGPDKKKPR